MNVTRYITSLTYVMHDCRILNIDFQSTNIIPQSNHLENAWSNPSLFVPKNGRARPFTDNYLYSLVLSSQNVIFNLRVGSGDAE